MNIKNTIMTGISGLTIGTGLLAADECKQLSYLNGDINNGEIYIETTDIKDGKGQIGEFQVEIKGKVIKVFIPNSDTEEGYARLINNGDGDCKIGEAIVK